MTIALRILLLVMAVWMTAYMLKRIRQSKLQIEYSVFWILLDALILLLAIFPQILTVFAGLLGVYSPTNLLFALILFILLLKIFMMTLEISSLETSIRKLAQVIALKEEKEAEEDTGKAAGSSHAEKTCNLSKNPEMATEKEVEETEVKQGSIGDGEHERKA